MKYLFLVPLIFILSCVNREQKPPEPNVVDNNNATDSMSQTLSIIAVGDMMLGSDFPNKNRLPSKNILRTLQDTLKNADLTIGNLEGVIASPQTITEKCKGSKNCYVFRMPLHFSSYFKDAGFDFLSIANNHSGDFGNQGIKETMNALDKEGIAYAGLKDICEYSFVEKNEIKIGFIGAGHGGRHVHINNYGYMKELIQKIKPQCDILIVFFHGGAEGSDKENVPRATETLHGENRGNVYQFAHNCIDAGADMVIGSGPHVTRAVELYKNKFIAYSLGNFATYGMSTQGPLGLAPILKLSIAKNGNFISGQIIPTIQLGGNVATPKVDTAKRVVKIMKRLTAKDFPETNLNISADGSIKIKNF